MPEILSGLCALGIFLGVIAVIGHGIWIGVRGVFRLLAGGGKSIEPVNTKSRCPRCASAWEAGRANCLVCDWPGPVLLPHATIRALRQLREQISDLRTAGILTEEARLALTKAIDDESGRVVQPAPALATLSPTLRMPTPAATPPIPPPPPMSRPELAPIPLESGPRTPEVLHEVLQRMQNRPAEPEVEVAVVAEIVELADRPAPVVRPLQMPQPAPRVTLLQVPPPPRRSFGELFISFMEERNIRWGELVGGLLIICCSIALVISFWSEIAERPILKFIVFNGVTAALFAAAAYTERRWKLPNTSRGLFIIASLLAPLNFLAMAAFSTATAAPAPLTFAGEVISVALFSGLLWFASRSLAPSFTKVMAPAIMLSAIAELLVRHWIAPQGAMPILLGVGSLPVIAMLGTALAVRVRSDVWEKIEEKHAHELFRLVALVAFAGLAAAGLLIFRAGANAQTLENLSPLMALYGCGPLAIGLLLWRRLRDSDLTGMRIAGTAIAVAGVMLMLLGATFAWPQPGMMVVVLAVEAAVLFAVARVSGIPAAVLPACACATAAYVMAWCGFSGEYGELPWRVNNALALAKPLLNAKTGQMLVAAVAFFGAAAAWCARRGASEASRYFGVAAGLNVLVSLLLVTAFGLARVGDPEHVTWVFALYGTGALIAGHWIAPRVLVPIGSLLWLVATVQGLVFGQYGGFEQPWVMAMLLHATAFTLIVAIAGFAKFADNDWRESALWTAGATTALGMLLAQWGFFDHSATHVALQLVWVSALWFAIAYQTRSQTVFAVFQGTSTLALLAGVTGYLQQQPWYQASRAPLLDPYTLECWGIALAASCLAWRGAAALLGQLISSATDADVDVSHDEARWNHRLVGLFATSPAVGRLALSLAVVLLVGLSIYAIVPGVAQELSPRSLAAALTRLKADATTRIVAPVSAYEIPGIPHVHAWSVVAWALLATILVALVAESGRRLSRVGLATFLLIVSLGCLLLAARFEVDVAAASALRWIGALYLLAVSAGIWARDPLARLATRWGWKLDPTESDRFAADAWLAALAGLLLPLLGMGFFVASAAVVQRPPEAFITQWLLGLLALFAVACAIGGALVRMESAPSGAVSTRGWAGDLGRLSMVLGAMPLVAMALFVISTALRGNPVVGPDPASWFGQLGLAKNYATPLAILTITLLGHALRERSSVFALSAGLMLNLSATAGYLLVPRTQGLTLDAVLWVKLAQLNAGVAAGFAILWLAAVAVHERRRGVNVLAHDSCRATQAMLGLTLLAIVFIPAAVSFWWEASLLNVHFQIGSAAGWWPLGLAVFAATLHVQTSRTQGAPETPRGVATWLLAKPIASIGVVAAAAWTLSVMAAFNVGAISGFGSDWHAFHTLLAGHLVSAAGILALGLAAVHWRQQSRPDAQRVVPWVLLFTFLTCAVALRGTIEDYQRSGWAWSVIGLAGAALVLTVLAAFAERRRYLYGAGLCVNLVAMTLFFSPLVKRFSFAGDAEAVLVLGWFNVLAFSLPVAIWLWIERRFIEPNTLARRRPVTFGVHRFSAAAAALLMTATVVVGIVADIDGQPIFTPEWLGWCALAGTFIAVLACCWDPRVRGGALSLYLLGIVGIGFAVDRFNLPLKWLIFHGAVITAAYAIATSYLWSRREGLSLLARRLKMPVDAQQPWRTLTWLVSANCLLIAGVLALVTQIVLTFEEPLLRLAAAKAAWFQVVALMLLTRGEKQNHLRFGGLLLGMVGATLWGWAWLNPSDGQQVLDRGVIAMAVLAGSGVLYGFGLIKLLKAVNPWLDVSQRLTPVCIGGALVALALILGGEVAYFFGSESVPMAHWSEAVVGASLVGLAIAAIVAAVVPGRDPLGLSERGRQVYVYGAEILLAATFLHVRICLPEYFEGHFRKYWPLIVMAIAFLGVGLSEWFRRRNQAVLSQPLERTGALLPLLPVLGFWMIEPSHFQTNYSVLLLVVGGLYAALAVLRRSFGFGILAALAANGGLWYFLQKQPGFGLLEHPQIWLIPPAICVLVAAYLNRERLTPAQMTQIRYITAMTIYVSSTADVFLNGMDDAPWLPFVLGGLAIVGVMAGILFRVRAFLYLGTSFLVLSLLCMIYHAAHDLGQTWLWYACGIALGALIYVAFAVVEKKRQEFLHVLERLKEWEA